jgi:tetratricopeptide (TPR) repeat protein
MLIVQVCDFGEDGDARYRMHEPSRHLGRLPGVTAVDCHFSHRYLPAMAERADVLVLQFVNEWELLTLCERRRAAGRITVFEANDDFFDLQPWSPNAAHWQDRTVQELYLQLLGAADGVQTSSNALAERWRGLGARQVAVFPNQLTEVAPLSPVPERPLTVGWGGSPGHFADWYEVAPHLNRWLAAHPEVHLAVMTHELARPFFDLPPGRYRFTPFGSLDDYLRFLRSLDIGLAPLLPTGFNRGRSDVKFLEYASQGVAGLYADLEPYRGSVDHGETGLLYRTPAELIEGLERLRTEPALRHRLRRQAYESLTQNRLLSDHIGERLAWYRGLLPSPFCSSADPLPIEIQEASERDAGYLRLRPQEPELALLEASKRSAPGEASPLLAGLLERQPDYLAALQAQGQRLNDLRDHRSALEVLERARALAPQSARTLSEIGRAWYRLGDERLARAVLEEAIGVSPRFLPAWLSLLRLLSLCRSPDGPVWAEKAEALFPACYPVALAGVRTYPPARALVVLSRVLERFASTISPQERPRATSAFRQAILEAVEASPCGPDVVLLLRLACQVFPESARLAGELGVALRRDGQPEEAFPHEARALTLRRQAALEHEEFPRQETSPYSWLFAEHILAIPRH